MMAPDVSRQETVRNVFFIDPEQTIRAILVYPLTNGRSIPEILRLLTALQTTDREHVVTPPTGSGTAGPGAACPGTYDELLSRQNNPQAQHLECEDWFLCSRQIPGEAKQ